MNYYWHENELPQATDAYPAMLRPYLLPSYVKTYMEGDKGSALLQSMQTAHFHIWFSHFFISEDTAVYADTTAQLVTMHFMLAGAVTGDAERPDGPGLDNGTYQLFYVPAGERYRIPFAAGNYHSARIDFETAFLEQMAAFFPAVSTLIDALNCGSPAGIRMAEGHITFRVRTILEELAATDSTKQGGDLLLHARVYELLWLYLCELGSTDEQDWARLYFKKLQQIQEYISMHLDEELGTGFLAKHFAISATTLKRQFKYRFGLTIREFLLQQRMNAALELLTHTDLSVHTIGARVGYPEFSSFTRAFTRFFGHSPIHARKP